MIKYDDIISTLALVNILAKDFDYGNVKNIKQDTIDIIKTYLRLNTVFYNFVIRKICYLKVVSFKYFCRFTFLKLNKSLIIFLQKILLYCQQLILEYG